MSTGVYIFFGFLMLIGLAVGLYFLITFIKKKKKKNDTDDDNGDNGNSIQCLSSSKPNCINSSGITGTVNCNFETGLWENCPSGYCDANKKLVSNGCSLTDQQCVADSTDSTQYNWKCICGSNISSGNPTQDTCSIYSSNALAYCDSQSNTWKCSCYDKNLTSSNNSCSIYGSNATLTCSPTSKDWDCLCNNISRTDPNSINCSNMNSTYQCATDQTTGSSYWTCECNETTLEDSSTKCDSNQQLVCSTNASGQNWECKTADCTDITPITCIGGLAPQCVLNSDGITSSYECLGLTCNISSKTDCNSTIGTNTYLLTSNNSLLNPNYYKYRSLYSIYCSTADDINNCMSSVDSQLSNFNYQTPDYIKTTCNASSLNSNTNYCTRVTCPKPISIHNMNASNNSLLAGCLSPDNEIFDNSISPSTSLTKLNVFSTELSTFFSFDAGYINYGSAFIIFPVQSNKQWNTNSGQLFWVTIAGAGVLYTKSNSYSKKPVLSNNDKSSGSLLLRIYPFQNFHPFLLWRMAPHAFGWGNKTSALNSLVKVNQNYYSQMTHGRTDGNHSFLNPTNCHFFLLMHLSSMLYVDTKGCHAISGDNGQGCHNNGANYLPLSVLTCDEYNFYYNFMLKGSTYDWTSNSSSKNPFLDPKAIPSNTMGIYGKGEDINNLFTIYGIDSVNKKEITCNPPTPSDPPTDNLDVTNDKNNAEFNLSCGTYFTSPVVNSDKRVNYMSISNWFPSNYVQLFHRKGTDPDNNDAYFTLFYAFDLSLPNTQNQMDGLSFMKQYADNNQLSVPFVQYPKDFLTSNTNIFAYNQPSNYFLSPIQYSLLVPNNSDSKDNCLKYRMTVYMLLYTWNDDLSDWFLTGELLHKNNTSTSYVPILYNSILTTSTNKPYDFDSEYQSIGQWFLTSYFPINEFNTKISKSNKIQNGPSEWSIHLSYYQSGTEYFILPDLNTNYNSIVNTYSVTNSNIVPTIWHQVTSNGHIYYYDSNTNTKYFLAVNGSSTSLQTGTQLTLFYIDLITYSKSTDDNNDFPFYCPMFCIFYQYSSANSCTITS